MAITDTELKLIAALAMIGLSSAPRPRRQMGHWLGALRTIFGCIGQTVLGRPVRGHRRDTLEGPCRTWGTSRTPGCRISECIGHV